jgi:uncharacterized protein YutD
MGEIENIAMHIFHAYEDFFLDLDKRKIFEDIFDKYLSVVADDGKTEPYDAILLLAEHHRADFDQMVKTLRDHSLIPG